MLKKSPRGVLASLRGSTYRSVRLASLLAAALLAAFLSILKFFRREHSNGKLQPYCGRQLSFPQSVRAPIFRAPIY